MVSQFLVAQAFQPVRGFSHRLERRCHQTEELVGKDKVLMGGNRTSSCAQSINGNLQSNGYFPVGADPCVRPGLGAHTRVRPHNAAFFDCDPA
jgi:hypothetical protein